MSKNVLQGGGIGKTITHYTTLGVGDKPADKLSSGASNLIHPGGGAAAAAPVAAVDNSATDRAYAQANADKAGRAYASEQERKAAGLASGTDVTDNAYDSLGAGGGSGVRSNARKKLLG